ncbi:MAG: polyamine aminopropyltransferase [Euzebya sp.]
MLLLAALVCAACGIIYELALIALGSYLVGSSVTQTAVVVSVTLSAMGLGALVAKPLVRWPTRAFAAVETMLGVLGGLSVLVLYAAFAWLDAYVPFLILTAVGVGSLIGMEIPLLMRMVQQVRAQDASQAVADLSAADYLGALVGGLAFPFLLLPLLGLLQGTVAVGMLNVVGGWCIAGLLFRKALSVRQRRLIDGFAVLAIAVLAVALVWSGRFETTARQALYDSPIVYSERSTYAEIVLTSEPLLGGGPQDLRLFLNGDLQFSSLDEYRYHEALVHPAMAGRHRRVLILGGGDGLALREVLRYDDVAQITLVDLDRAVTQLAMTQPALVRLNDGAFTDPRVRVVNADAFGWMRDTAPASGFDVVIVDLPDADSMETAKLYSVEFYGLIGHALASGGRLVVQGGSPYFAPQAYWSTEASVRTAGYATTAYHVDVPSFGDWGFVLAARQSDAPELRVARHGPGLRFLSPDVLRAAQVFPPDRLPTSSRASTLLDPVILDYSRRGWVGY